VAALTFADRTRKQFNSLAICILFTLAACSENTQPEETGQESTAVDQATGDGPLEGLVTVDRLPTPDDPTQLKGRDVWSGTCQGCHGLGIAGSPKITDKAAWAPRIAKGRETLHEHALNGFFGEDGAMMPERGGNSELTDDQVKAAVDFMVANSQ